MKVVVIVMLLMSFAVVAQGKDYTVSLDDKYVEYFEKAFVNENVKPEEWLGMQALNLADQVIDRQYVQQEITGKTRDDKIKEIKK